MTEDVALAACDFDTTTGYVTFRWSEGEFRLRPPNLGELRQLEELQEQAGAETEAAREAAGEGYVTPTQIETLTKNLTWWRLAFDLLAEKSLPPDDRCPAWLGTLPMIVRARTHWMSFPIPALGNLLQVLGAANNGAE